MTNHPSSVVWRCWLGHPTCQISSPKWDIHIDYYIVSVGTFVERLLSQIPVVNLLPLLVLRGYDHDCHAVASLHGHKPLSNHVAVIISSVYCRGLFVEKPMMKRGVGAWSPVLYYIGVHEWMV